MKSIFPYVCYSSEKVQQGVLLLQDMHRVVKDGEEKKEERRAEENRPPWSRQL